MTSDEIKQLIANNRLEEAVKALLAATKNDTVLYNKVISLSGLVNKFLVEQHSVLSGREGSETYQRLTDSLTAICDQVIFPSIPPPPIRKPTIKPYIWVLGSILALLAIFIALNTSGLLKPKVKYCALTVNLYADNNLHQHPVKEGILALTAVDYVYDKEALIDAKGNAIFDSIPIELNGKAVSLDLAAEGYKLKNQAITYTVNEKINVEIEKLPEPVVVKLVESTPNPVSTNPSCPTKTPEGVPLNGQVPPEKRNGEIWLKGYYKKVAGRCVWEKPSWKKIEQPSLPPAGYQENTKAATRTGYKWVTGQYIWENDQWKWKPGRWIRVSDIPIKVKKTPSPLYVPPPRPRTY